MCLYFVLGLYVFLKLCLVTLHCSLKYDLYSRWALEYAETVYGKEFLIAISEMKLNNGREGKEKHRGNDLFLQTIVKDRAEWWLPWMFVLFLPQLLDLWTRKEVTQRSTVLSYPFLVLESIFPVPEVVNGVPITSQSNCVVMGTHFLWILTNRFSL